MYYEYMLWMVLCVSVSYSHDSFPCSIFPIFGQWESLHFESSVLLTELFILKGVLIFWLRKMSQDHHPIRFLPWNSL